MSLRDSHWFRQVLLKLAGRKVFVKQLPGSWPFSVCHICLKVKPYSESAERHRPLKELLARKKLSTEVVGRLSDRVLLIRPGRAVAVLEELKKMGHTPQVVGK